MSKKTLYSAVLALVVVLFSSVGFAQDAAAAARVVMLERVVASGVYLMDATGNVYRESPWGKLRLIGNIAQAITRNQPGDSPDYGFWLFQPLRDLVGLFLGERIGVFMFAVFPTPPTGMVDFLPVKRLSQTTGIDYFEVPAAVLNPGRHVLTLDQGRTGWSGLIVSPAAGEVTQIAANVRGNGKRWETVYPRPAVTVTWSTQAVPEVATPAVIFNSVTGAGGQLSGSVSFTANESRDFFLAVRSQTAAGRRITAGGTAFVQVK